MQKMNEIDNKWKGDAIEDIRTSSTTFDPVKPVKPNEMHTVLYHLPILDTLAPPKPHKGYFKWDSFHVHLPCSSKNLYPNKKADGTTVIEPRWKMIQNAFKEPIKDSRDLEARILSYNSKYCNIWKFDTLHELFEKDLDSEEADKFFKLLLPQIINLALQIPDLIGTAIPLLKKKENRTVSLSQQQVACLLANAFLCTFPKRNTLKRKSEYCRYPSINFNRLFQSSGQSCIEKIKCICNYFRRVCNRPPTGVVTFQRRYISSDDLPVWNEQTALIGDLKFHITSEGTIEDDGGGLLQVDFANKYLGGGVLGQGCVQEEIRFVICPELMLSKLFTEELEPQEALVIIGSERYSTYSGYASSFKWTGNYEDTTPYDSSRRRKCYIVAIDAKEFYKPQSQYTQANLLRELNKAYVGFHNSDFVTPAQGVATGNWGCGAFGGEARLKSILQLMVTTTLIRPLVYFTFGDERLRDEVFEMFQFCKTNRITVGQLFRFIEEFNSKEVSAEQIYSFIFQKYYESQKKSANEFKTSDNLKKNEEENDDCFDSPIPSTSASVEVATKKATDKTKVNSNYSRNILYSDETSSSSTLQSRFAHLVLPTKKRPATSPMGDSTKKKSLLEALDEEYYGDCRNKVVEVSNKVEKKDPEIDKNEVLNDEQRSEVKPKNKVSEINPTISKPPLTQYDSNAQEIEMIACQSNSQTSTDSDEVVPCSPFVQAPVSRIRKPMQVKSQEQKVKISDYFKPKA